MKLHFLGANRQVTGSRYCVEVDDFRLLVDCGMFQEREYQKRNWDECPIPATDIDAVVLTHAHIDHIGLLPRLVRQGFSGPVYATKATVDLADIMLKDAAHIQMEDIKYKKRRHEKQGKKSPFPYEPLFDDVDAEETLKLLVGVGYENAKEINDRIAVTFHEAGHILGSSSLELDINKEDGEVRTLVFSGDIGQNDKPIIRDPKPVGKADYLVLESTYGDRDHKDAGDVRSQLETILSRTLGRGGKVIIPTFAVERAQELMYHIGQLAHANAIPDVPIFLDSPMAVDVTKIFMDYRELFDVEAMGLVKGGIPPLRFPGLKMLRKTEDSMALNDLKGPAIIMSTSGMCTAGRIKHHLKNHMGNEKNTILFVGYQGHGTLGRVILEGKKMVRIHGREHEVVAKVEQIFGFSGHADRGGLIEWAKAFKTPPKKVFLTHGDGDAAESLKKQLNHTLGWRVHVPNYHETVNIE